MISFACHCGEKFQVPESQAGDQFQCPRCMRLVDVPQLSDLGNLAEDGTFNMYAIEPTPSDLGRKMETFSFTGDRRTNVEDFLAIGVRPEDTAPPPRTHGPRYDPETGERIMPVDLRPDPLVDAPHAIPMASPVLGYATNVQTPESAAGVLWWQMPWRLVSGVNLFAVGFVFIAHVAVQFILAIPGANFILSPFVLFAVPMIVAHYCNTMEDFGANRRDRVPVMFRNGSVGEDLIRPLVYVLVSTAMVMLPLIVLAIAYAKTRFVYAEVWANLLFYLGLFAFPAVIFTGLNSGAMQNLTPRRIFSVIRAAPMRYLWASTAFAAAIAAYALAFEHYTVASVSVLQIGVGAIKLGGFAKDAMLAVALQAVAIYIMHLAAAWMGLIYQSHYEKFDWVLQRHQKVVRTDTVAQLAEMRRNGDPRVHPTKKAPAPASSPNAPRPVQAVLPIEPPPPSARALP